MRKEYTPEEDDDIKEIKEKFGILDGLLGEIIRTLKGDKFFEEKGFIKIMLEFKLDMEARMAKQEQKTKGRFTLLIGVAIGVAAASVLYGVMTIQQLKEIIRSLPH